MKGRTLVLLLVAALVAAGGVYLIRALRASDSTASAPIDATAPQADAIDPKLRGKRPVVPPVAPHGGGGGGSGSETDDPGLPKPRVDLRGVQLRDAGAPGAAAPPVSNSLDPAADDAGVDEAPPDAAVRLKGR